MIIIDRFWWTGTDNLTLLVLAHKSKVHSAAAHVLLGDLQGLACPSFLILIEEKREHLILSHSLYFIRRSLIHQGIICSFQASIFLFDQLVRLASQMKWYSRSY